MEGMFYHWHHATELLEKSLAEEVPPGYYSASEGVGYRIRSRREAEAYREGFWRVHDCPAAAMVEKNHNLPG
jgi:hypothetical protein